MLDSFGIGAANAKHGRSVDWTIVSITSSTLIAPMLASLVSFFIELFEISILIRGMVNCPLASRLAQQGRRDTPRGSRRISF